MMSCMTRYLRRLALIEGQREREELGSCSQAWGNLLRRKIRNGPRAPILPELRVWRVNPYPACSRIVRRERPAKPPPCERVLARGFVSRRLCAAAPRSATNVEVHFQAAKASAVWGAYF